MSMIKMQITCRDDECECEYFFDAEYSPADKGSRECPPHPAELMAPSEVICPECGLDNAEYAQELCDDYDFSQDEPDYDDRDDDE